MVIPSILLPLFIEGQDRPLPFKLTVALAAAVDDPQCVAIVLSAAGGAGLLRRVRPGDGRGDRVLQGAQIIDTSRWESSQENGKHACLVR